MEKVIVWGCGKLGRRIFKGVEDLLKYEIVAYTDICEKFWGGVIYGTPVISPEEIDRIEFDKILVAIADFEAMIKVKNLLLNMGIVEEKVSLVSCETEFLDALMDQRMCWIRDFARYVEAEKIEGNVAECGVFRGDSAKFINKFFKNRELYLFDTFEGFADEDIKKEIILGNESYNQSIFTSKELFDRTSIDLVLTKMTYPNKVRIHKGYFPDSAEGIEETFCFVNLDMDLYTPMLNGLRFFWDKLSEGGGILLHDYFHQCLPGVKKAVNDFEQERGICVKKVPIGDSCSIFLLK